MCEGWSLEIGTAYREFVARQAKTRDINVKAGTVTAVPTIPSHTAQKQRHPDLRIVHLSWEHAETTAITLLTGPSPIKLWRKASAPTTHRSANRRLDDVERRLIFFEAKAPQNEIDDTRHAGPTDCWPGGAHTSLKR